jgi:sporulation protein YlmC with PRC-barrel domain
MMKTKLAMSTGLFLIFALALFATGAGEQPAAPAPEELPEAPEEEQYEAASRVLDYELLNWEGKRLGRVADLVFDLGTGHIMYIVIRVPRPETQGARMVPVPFSYLIVDREERAYRIAIQDPALLENAPGYDEAEDFVNWRVSRGYSFDVYSYWAGAGANPPSLLRGKLVRSQRPFMGYGFGPGTRLLPGALMSFSDLRGFRVVGNGQVAGAIAELVVELVSGRAASVFFRFFANREIYPTPLSSFTFDQRNDEIELDVDASRFQHAETVPASRMAQAARKGNWGERYHDYWIDRQVTLAFRSGMRIMPAFRIAATALQETVVQSWLGVRLGTIEDAVIERSGNLPFAMISPSGGLLSGPDRWYPVPTQALSLDRYSTQALLGLNRQQMQQLPGFERGRLPDTRNPGWDETILGYWEGILSPETDFVLRQRRGIRGRRQDRPQAVLLSEFLGFEVRNPVGRRLGRVRDLMIDLDTASVDYVVFSFEELPGVDGDRRYPIPFQALELEVPFSGIVLDAEPARVRQAPAFAEDQWPALVDPARWAEQARGFWSER